MKVKQIEKKSWLLIVFTETSKEGFEESKRQKRNKMVILTRR